MDNAVVFWAIAVLGAIILYYMRVYFKNKKYYNNLTDKIMNGKSVKNSYHDSDYERIKKYYNEKKKTDEKFHIDNITWDDLDVEDAFEIIDNTITHMGEATLYYMLRTPILTLEELNVRKKHIEILSDDNGQRRKIVEKLVKIEKNNESNILKILFDQILVTFPSFTLLAGLSLGLFVSIIMALFNPQWFFPAVLLFVFNITLHYKNLKDMRIVCDSVNESVKLIKSFNGMKADIKNLVRDIPNIDARVFSITRNPVAILQGITDMITEILRMIFLLDLMYFSAKEKTIKKYKQDILYIYKTVGYVDAINSIVMYRNKIDYFCEPVFNENKKTSLICKDVFHPMLDKPVSNSINFIKPILLTGSNASGKSTFLKTIALNTVLAQSIITVHAKEYSGSVVKVMTSIALRDNIQDGDSYFVAEIKSLKRIFDSLDEKIPVLCIIDEILRGTNTIERISASSQVLHSFSKENMLVIAATHDHELCSILNKSYENYHFEEQIKDNKIEFDYRLKKGPSETKNAIKLLEIFEFKKEVVKAAENQYNNFMKTGKWETGI